MTPEELNKKHEQQARKARGSAWESAWRKRINEALKANDWQRVQTAMDKVRDKYGIKAAEILVWEALRSEKWKPAS